jgi:hypothetical protein
MAASTQAGLCRANGAQHTTMSTQNAITIYHVIHSNEPG